MANRIVLKKSSVAAKVPLTTDLEYGELALNYADEKLYFKNSSNAVKSFNVTQSTLTIGTGLSGTSYNGTTAVTVAIDSTVATLTGTQTLTNKTISGASNTLTNIANSSLTNSSLTIGSTSISLGATATTLAGLTSVTSTTFVGALTGNATNVTGTVAIANGGTGQTTRQAAMDALAGAVTAGLYLRGNGTDVVMSAIQAADVPTLNQNTTGSAATLTTARNINGTSFNGSADITVPLNTTNRTTNETGHMVFTGTTATGNVSAYTNTAVRVNPSQGRVEANGISAAAGLIEHANNITVTYTMKTGNNAISAGPVTIDTGGSITIPDGSTWIIVSPT